MTDELVRLTGDDHDLVARYRRLAFGVPDDERLHHTVRTRLDAGVYQGWRQDGTIRGVAALTVEAHWFGGRQVPCQHVASVAVPPEYRGAGVASGLMRAVLARGAADGLALSVLFPATTRLYRRLGYEHAGRLARYLLPARHAPSGASAMRPAETPADWAALRACDQAGWQHVPGAMVRSQEYWDDARATGFTYVLDSAEGDGVEAYLCFEPTPIDWQYRLTVRAWAATTPRGLAALLGFVGGHGSIGKEATLTGPVPHPFTFLLPEQDLKPVGGMEWMARGLNLSAAIGARGFPPVDLDLSLQVVDEQLPAAARGWRLEIAGGKGRLEPMVAAPGDAVRLNARAFGPLYTGFCGSTMLAQAGLLEAAPRERELLDLAFAGPLPVLLDFF